MRSGPARPAPSSRSAKRPRSPCSSARARCRARPRARCPRPPSAVHCPSSLAIRWTGTRFEISRAVFETPPSPGFVHTPRIVPFVGNGQPRGFKVYGILPCSLSDRLGLRNGDLVVSINGVEPLTPDSLLEAYESLRKATDFTVLIERQGQLVTQLYHLYDAPKPRRAVVSHRSVASR